MMRLDARIEHGDERDVRLGIARRAKWLADIKGAILFLVVLAGLIAVALIAARAVFFETDVTPEVRRWAETVLTALVSGGFSYLVGRAVGGTP